MDLTNQRLLLSLFGLSEDFRTGLSFSLALALELTWNSTERQRAINHEAILASAAASTPLSAARREVLSGRYPEMSGIEDCMPDDFRQVTDTDLRTMAHSILGLSNAALVVVGDVDPEATIENCERLMTIWPAGGQFTLERTSVLSPSSAWRIMPTARADHVAVIMSCRVGSRQSADFPAAQIFDIALAGSHQSRLVSELRERMGVVYQVTSGFESSYGETFQALQNPECSFGLKPPDSSSDLAT